MVAGAYREEASSASDCWTAIGSTSPSLESPNTGKIKALIADRDWHATLPARPHGPEMGCRVLQLGTDPLLDVASSVSEVPADPETSWPEASVAPAVDRLHRHVQVPGEVLGAEQFIESFHLHIVARVDVNWVTSS
jgi:hypothetical protein